MWGCDEFYGGYLCEGLLRGGVGWVEAVGIDFESELRYLRGHSWQVWRALVRIGGNNMSTRRWILREYHYCIFWARI